MKPFRIAALRVLAFVLAVTAAASVHAADARPESPGWYSTKIGRFTVTALWDGTLEMPVDEVFARPGPAQLKALRERAYLPATMPMSVNAFVVDTGQRIVMIDTGTGASRMFGDGLGKVPANLRAAGYTPEQIDEVYLTHMHTDHIGGLTVDGRAVFPKAVVRADVREAGHYLSREKMAAAGEAKDDFESAIAMLAAVASGPSTAAANSSPACARCLPRGTRPATRSMWSRATARSWCCGAT